VPRLVVITVCIDRACTHEGDTLFFSVRPGSLSRPWKFLEPTEVPEFEGKSAWFEVEYQSHHGAWRFLRRLEDRAT
jgi:hypothetical protein